MSVAATVEKPEVRSSLLTALVRIVALTALFSASAVYESAHVTAVSSGDVWWHLRTGMWILQNHSVPRSGLFSQYPSLPWMASSWGFDVLLAAAYRLLGLRAIPFTLMAMKVALAVLTFLLARAGRISFWNSVLLSAVAQSVIVNLQPLPSVISIAFLAAELWLLVRSRRRTGSLRELYWLPFLFAAWANLDLQFVAGLVLLGVFVAAVVVEGALRSAGVGWLDQSIVQPPIRPLAIVAGCSLLATLANPYTFHLLPNFFKALYSDALFQHSPEMKSMSFRRPQEYLLMLVVMAAFLAMGRRRSLRVFELAALVAGTAIAFRLQRDAWMCVLPAVAVLADGFGSGANAGENKSPDWSWKAVAACVAVVFVVIALRLPSQALMISRVSEKFPVKACDFIRANHLPAPLFNAYSWGGFLTWYLPDYPVAIDTRVDLYGHEIVARYFSVTDGKERLEADTAVSRAQTLLVERQSGMTKALMTLPALSAQYRLVYSDELAAVFARR
jgi:hypothetical protein